MSLEIDGYTIQKTLGTGGMSTVYLAIQDSLGRPCALKVMSSALTKGDSFTHRFKLEGKTIAKLQHSNIVNIYDIATNDDCCYIAMEYLPGATLHERLHDDLSLKDVLSIVKQVARALGFAHEHHIVHRDIKPANIMFRRDGTVVLTDFGIAKHLSEETAALTGTGSLIGTPAYMSPEQIQVGTLTGRSDLYSLGVVFYETLIGVQPYVASNPIAVAFMHVNKPIPTLPESVGFLQDLLNKVLAKEPAQRFQNAAELIDAIEKIEREHDTERIMLLHSSNGDVAQASDPAEPQSLLSQFPDTKLITVLDDGKKVSHQPPPSPPPSSPSRNTKKWLALAALIGILAWGGISYRGYRAEQQELEYTKLLEVAQRQIRQQRFVEPENDNLYTTLTALNELEAGDPRADAATIAFIDQIMIESRREQAHGTFDASLALIDKGLQFAPDDVGLTDLRNQVEAQNRQRQKELRQQQQEQAIERLLALAQAQIEAEQLTAPDGDNAVNSLRQVLALAPKQEQALAGLDVIAERYAERSAAALAGKNEDLARDIIAQGLTISASNKKLLKQRETLQERIAQRKQAQQAKLERKQKTEELLATAKTQLEQGNLVSPEGANAAHSYRQVLQLHKGNEKARAGLLSVAAALAKRAKSKLQEGELAAGLVDIEAALAISPNDKALLRQQQQITERQQEIIRTERERQEKIQKLLQLAQTQISQRKLNTPANDNAVHSLQQVLVLEPAHPQAIKGLKQVADVYESLAREQLARDADSRSNNYADAGLRVVAEHNGLLAVKRELLERKREKELRESTEREARGQQINKLLETASKQFEAQQFTTPDSDNAYATWRAVLTLEPDNRAAKQAISQLPEKILQQATADLDNGDLQRSQQTLRQGLQVWPDNAGLRALDKRVLQENAEQQRARDIAALMRKAEQQRREGKLFSPAKNNAVTSLQQALKLDANNADAKAALASIIEERLGSARDALQQEQFEQADALIGELKTVQSGHPKLRALESQLAVSRHIKSLLDEAQALAAQNLFTQPTQNNALLNYRKVLQLDPIHKQASDAVAQLRQRIFNSAQDALQARDWPLCSSLIEQGLVLLPGDKRLLALNSEMLTTQTQIAQQREERELAQRINRLLTVARNQMSRRQLSSPAGDNAVATLEQILVLDPENSDALQIKADIADRYVALTAEALQSEDEERALLYLERGLQVAPENTKLNAQQKELEDRKQLREAERLAQEQARELSRQQEQEADRLAAAQQKTEQKEIEEKRQTEAKEETQASDNRQLTALLKQAAQQREDKRFIAPAGDNALASYRQVLQLNPQSNAAKQGIKEIKSYYRSQVEAHREARNIPMAAAWVEAIRVEFPADATFKTLQQGLLQRGYRDTLRDSGRGPTLVYIPPGTFIMGDRSGNGFPNEKPAHKENVTRGFMLGRLEVSFEEFDRFVRASGAPSPSDQGWGRGSQPVINIDWKTAQKYLAWLSKQSGQQYQLPSEIEWEYATRAGTDSDYWWGERIGSKNANCKGCGSQYGGKRTMAVGSFKANPFGLFDTAGNVHEWVSSPYGNKYPSDGSTVKGPGSNAVARGGSWYDAAKFSRASMRVILKPGFKNFFVGFRVLRALPTPTEKQ
ncbi:MAG: protein kinase domain-containing protein [Pseudomonadales bacterium]